MWVIWFKISRFLCLPEPLKINAKGKFNMQGVKINLGGEPCGQQ